MLKIVLVILVLLVTVSTREKLRYLEQKPENVEH